MEYVLKAKTLKVLASLGYKLECDYCGEKLKEGDVMRQTRGDRYGKVLFHAKCFEFRKEEVRDKLYSSQPRPKRNPTLRPKKIKSDITMNLYYCFRCKQNVHCKVTRDDYGKITEFTCVECGEAIIRPMSGSFYLGIFGKSKVPTPQP
jgi:hypothetical protein